MRFGGSSSTFPHSEHRNRAFSAVLFFSRFTTACQHSPHSMRYGQKNSGAGLSFLPRRVRFPVPGGFGFSGFHAEGCFGWSPALLGILTFESRRCMSFTRLLPSTRLQTGFSHPQVHRLAADHRPFSGFVYGNGAALQKSQRCLLHSRFDAVVQALQTFKSCLTKDKAWVRAVNPKQVSVNRSSNRNKVRYLFPRVSAVR